MVAASPLIATLVPGEFPHVGAAHRPVNQQKPAIVNVFVSFLNKLNKRSTWIIRTVNKWLVHVKPAIIIDFTLMYNKCFRGTMELL